MRTHLAALVVLAGILASSPEASAQVIVSGPISVPASPSPGGWTYSSYYVPPYSYYAAMPLPARGYFGYGSNDFPYYGQPYGNPSDPWTWPYLGGGYRRALSKYYYPPVQ